MSKRSVEEIKLESNYLRGNLAELMGSGADHVDEDGKTLVKFHGMYQQDDRYARKDRKKEGKDLLYFFMVRSKIPGGRLTARQYLVHDELADKYGNGTIRLTTRQDIQMHGVFMKNVRQYVRAINEALVTTLGACGDVCRNTLCCPAPIHTDSLREQMQDLTVRLTRQFLPRTTSYYEVWLNGSTIIPAPAPPTGEVIEPLYGKFYLPRKFKIAITLPEDNCVDALANDIALLAKVEGDRIVGYDVYAGGGMGMTHGMLNTYPRLASPVCYASNEDVAAVCESLIKVHRDFGNREDRKLARLKYVMDGMGPEKFFATLQDVHGRPLAPFTGLKPTGIDDHLGWHKQGDGKWWLGLPILAGRIKDDEHARIRTGLRKIIAKYQMPVRITATQNLLLCDIDSRSRSKIDEICSQHGIKRVEEICVLERHAMACPALPTCGLSLAESENVLASLVQSIDQQLASLALNKEDVVVHMTGCPNGCARPYNSDIGIVGRQPGKYTLFLGGNRLGDALSYQYQDLVPMEEIPRVLHGPLVYYKQEREAGEGFGDFCRRKGLDEVRAAAERITGGNGATPHAKHAVKSSAPVNGKPAEPAATEAKPKAAAEPQVAERDDRLVFPLYFKGKADGAILVPRELNAHDCQVLELALQQIRAYTQQKG